MLNIFWLTKIAWELHSRFIPIQFHTDQHEDQLHPPTLTWFKPSNKTAPYPADGTRMSLYTTNYRFTSPQPTVQYTDI